MERIQALVGTHFETVRAMIRTEPMNEIHLPSFVLGCFITISLSFIGPLMKIFVGNILVTVITLVKYLVIISGIIACIMVVTSKTNKVPTQPHDVDRKNNAGTANIESEKEKVNIDHDDVVELRYQDELAKDNFEAIKYCNIPITKSRFKNVPINNAYDSFINRAAIKETDNL